MTFAEFIARIPRLEPADWRAADALASEHGVGGYLWDLAWGEAIAVSPAEEEYFRAGRLCPRWTSARSRAAFVGVAAALLAGNRLSDSSRRQLLGPLVPVIHELGANLDRSAPKTREAASPCIVLTQVDSWARWLRAA